MFRMHNTVLSYLNIIEDKLSRKEFIRNTFTVGSIELSIFRIFILFSVGSLCVHTISSKLDKYNCIGTLIIVSLTEVFNNLDIFSIMVFPNII